MGKVFLSKMKEDASVSSKERMIDFGIDLKEISKSIMLHLDGGD
jgi:hypothetical protein